MLNQKSASSVRSFGVFFGKYRILGYFREHEHCTWQNADPIMKNPHHPWHGFQIIVQLWRSAPHLHNQAQTSNKAHDKFVPRRDCAFADHSRPSLSTALLSGWSSHLV